MRIASSMYYESLYGTKNSQVQSKLFDVNKQIASGLKIQYASDDVAAFTETMQLDNEMTALGQIISSTESGYKVSNQTDIVLNEFVNTMDRMKTLLVDAANGTHSEQSWDALADELRVLEDHLKNLSNTSINGEFLFAGSAVDSKPIADDGTYHGNDGLLKSFLGSNVQQQYNMPGSQLFLGEEPLIRREVSTNVVQTNLSKKFNFESKFDNNSIPFFLESSDTIRDFMGDTDGDIDYGNNKHHFYLTGVKSDGESFNKKISLSDDVTIDVLLDNIGKAYGNTPNLKVTNVSLNSAGQIVVEDKIKGSSKLEFHMVAAVDFDQANGNDDADVNNIIDLDSGETNFSLIMNNSSTAANSNLHVREFMKSPYDGAPDTATNIAGLLYDKTNFTQDGAILKSSIPQIVRGDNSFATTSTKISEVADISQGTSDISDDTLDGNSLRLVGKNVNGTNYDVQIDYASAGTTFSLDSDGDGNYDNGTYEIFDMDTPRKAVDADEMTYQQLMDVMNMVVTNNLPLGATAQDYDTAIEGASLNGSVQLSYDGKIEFVDMISSITKAEISIHDVNSGDFSSSKGSFMTFNANNSLVMADAKTDFFKELDEIVTSVEYYTPHPDSTSLNIRGIGVEAALGKMADLQEHIGRSHAVVGSQSNALTLSSERASLLEISTMTLRSAVVDTDLAEASLTLTQLNLNYESMLATVGKVSKLSLVNYL